MASGTGQHVLPTSPSQLLFLPGVLGNRQFWEPASSEISHPAERVFAAYPGFRGAPPNPAISNFDDLLNSIVSQIVRPTALIAQSMGGVIAIEAALRRPDLITHLVLVATSGGLDTVALGAVDWRQEFRQYNSDLPNWFESYSSDLTSELKSIEVPVLLIWGDCDPLSPVAIGEALMSHFPNANLQMIPGGEHDLAYRFPHSVGLLIEAHLLRPSAGNIEKKDEHSTSGD